MFLLLRISVCICGVGILLYGYINRQNGLTELRLQIPQLAKELKGIQEENTRLQYEIDRFESPILLMEMSRNPEFGHLKYPYLNDVMILRKREPEQQ
jgi:hypothetical protein